MIAIEGHDTEETFSRSKARTTMTKKAHAAGKSRHFELIKGESAKFWEVKPTAEGYEVHFGRIGTKGQTKETTFPDVEAAHEAMAKLIAEKLDEGYVEIAAHS